MCDPANLKETLRK
jgi:hypothetical protein